jgi:Oxidoreductase family, NAD-binding Rossmann fold/Oxidoreductase family, C-terminal alpha/beta domain
MPSLNRRDFMYDSAWLAAAAASVGPLANLASAAKPEAKKESPAEKLRVAVIGVRGRGMEHVRGFLAQPNCEIVTICDVDSAVIKNAMSNVEKKQGQAPKYEKDLRKVMDDKNVDIVSIATPNHWHTLAALWAMQAGKDVYVEKPVSHNVSEGRRLVEAAVKYNRICQAGTQSRSMKGMQEAIAFVQSSKIGKVKLARGLCYKLRPSIGKVDGDQEPPATMDYDLWCGPAPLKKPHRKTGSGTVHYDWHWIWDYGNGDLGNQGIHEMDKARWGLGKMALPSSVRSIGGRFGYVDDGETPNTQICLFNYGDCELLFEVRGLPSNSPYPGKESPKNGAKPQNFVGNVFYGSDGFVVCPSYNSGVAYDNDGKVLAKFSGGGDHFANFVAAVRSHDAKSLAGKIIDGHLSSALCHLGNVSYRLGTAEPLESKAVAFPENEAAAKALTDALSHLKDRKVKVDEVKCLNGKTLKLDPATETFIDDKAANELLTREYRKGFVVPATL